MVIEAAHDILGQTMRVKHIVGDLLEFARGRDLLLRDMDIKETIMGAYKMASAGVGSIPVEFALNTGPENIIIQADREQLERVFINLFSNAIEAMEPADTLSSEVQSRPGMLKTAIKEEHEKVNITVSDAGKGIPAEALDKIFEPFYSTKDKGTGLGLAIVFNTIKRHNGENSVREHGRQRNYLFITLP